MIRSYPLALALLLSLAPLAAQAAKVDVEKTAEGVNVSIDGKFFATYQIKSGNKPIIWPIAGPTGKEMTRQYPMKPAAADEKADHPHHRSLWFTHGDVNGISFWEENGKGQEIKHREFVTVEGGDEGVIVTKNDWMTPEGKVLCEDVRTHTFGGDANSRYIDFDITITAKEGDVTFGDTKEGTFGVRVPGTMKVTAKKGGKLINAQDQTDTDAWGKESPWVDYFGPVGDEQLGIAILNHPNSFRYPTYWHVRTYGLFAANPFGLHNFKNSNDVNGAHTIKKGESITFYYRVIFHQGDQKAGKIPAAFQTYSKLPKGTK